MSDDKCFFNGQAFSEGALVCANGLELRCSGNSWKETGYLCDQEDQMEQGEYTYIEGQQLETSLDFPETGRPQPDDEKLPAGLYYADRDRCFSFQDAGSNFWTRLVKSRDCKGLWTCEIRWNSVGVERVLRYRFGGTIGRRITMQETTGTIVRSFKGWNNLEGPDQKNAVSYYTDKAASGLVLHRVRNRRDLYTCVTLNQRWEQIATGYVREKQTPIMMPPNSNGVVEGHDPNIWRLTISIVAAHSDPR